MKKIFLIMALVVASTVSVPAYAAKKCKTCACQLNRQKNQFKELIKLIDNLGKFDLYAKKQDVTLKKCAPDDCPCNLRNYRALNADLRRQKEEIGSSIR